MSTDTRSPKRKLIDLKMAQSSAAMELQPWATIRRGGGDSWGQLAGHIFALTGEHVTVPWLISQLAELTDAAKTAGEAS